jgi:gas vesicle protein
MAENVPEDLKDTEPEGSNRLAWFLTGAMIGVIAAILYVPRSGKQTRDFLSAKTQRGKDAVAETSKDFVDASREMFERGRKVVEDAADLFDRARRLVRGEDQA